jgi:hypothetical protein
MSREIHTSRCEPAASIVAAFGGVPRVAEITKRSPYAVWAWMRPKHANGTDGEIPSGPRRKLVEYANQKGLNIPADIWFRTRSAA